MFACVETITQVGGSSRLVAAWCWPLLGEGKAARRAEMVVRGGPTLWNRKENSTHDLPILAEEC